MRDAELGDDDMDDIVPKVLMGWCERKESKSRGFGTGAWHRRYLYVSEPGTLQFFKDAEMDKEMDDPLDLRDATEFEPQQGKDRGTHMNILLQDGEIKLRFQHEEDVHLWKEGLAAWRAYSMEHESLHDGSGGLDGIVITGLDTDEVVNPLTPPKGSPIQANRKGPMAMPSPPKTSSAPSKDKAEYAATVSRGDDFELVRLESGEMNLSSAPDPMNGWLEKKTHHTGKMGKWQKKYFRISDSGILSYASSDKEDLHTSQIDLKLVVDIILLEEKGPDSGRFNIVMDDRVFKIKAPSAASAASWVEGLKAWQEYLLFNM
ncbi:unnamed protein product [Symbiodinium microadriaticum]|nr:unnamed protein product [Symbiodinium microadriaticum]